MNLYGITIDPTKDQRIESNSFKLLKDYYMLPEETLAQEAFARAAVAYCQDDLALAQRIYNYASAGWFMFASPVLSNAPVPGQTFKAMPISCFLTYVPDSLEGLIEHSTELRWLSVKGGGVGGHWSAVRAVSDKAPGPIPFLKTVDSDMEAYRQGRCYSPDTEILTDRGWIAFPQLDKDDLVATVDDKRIISFCRPTELVVEKHTGVLLHLQDNKNLDLLVTPDHSMIINRKLRNRNQGTYYWARGTEKIRAQDLPLHSEVRMFHSGFASETYVDKLTDSEKLQIIFQADGTGYNGSSISFHFAKERKVQRLLDLIKTTNWSYNFVRRNDKTTDIRIKISKVLDTPDFIEDKAFAWVQPHTRSAKWLENFLEEVSYWDSSRRKNAFSFSNTNKDAAEIVYTAAYLCGKSASWSELVRENRKNSYTVYVSDNNSFTTQAVTSTEIAYDGLVYCATVPSGMLLVRRPGKKAIVCGNTRKGSYAAYLDCDHPDILEFINIRTPTGGDVNRKCFNLHIAINWTDKFMNALAADEDWDLLDPNDRSVRHTLKARELWDRALDTRSRTGEPYFFFIDTARAALPWCQKQLGLDIHGSNLCIEIDLPTSETRSAVCCLSSLNLELWDEYESQATQVVGDIIKFLDNVLQAFIDNAPPELARAVASATAERSLGLGTMGFHSWLQKNNIAWESIWAVSENRKIFSTINAAAIAATKQLAIERGEFPDAEAKIEITYVDDEWGRSYTKIHSSSQKCSVIKDGEVIKTIIANIKPDDLIINDYGLTQLELFPKTYKVQAVKGKHSHSGRRNAHLIAVAPNANSAVANNLTSPSVEPLKSNAFTQKMRTGSFLVKNRYLNRLLKQKLDTDAELDATWNDIINNHGSVQHLSILSDEEKAVFKTAFEINQEWVVQHAADRQPWICQGQSINLFFPSGVPKTYVNKVHLQAWKQGLKSLYYLRTNAGVTADKVSIKHERQALGDYVADKEEECLACHA